MRKLNVTDGQTDGQTDGRTDGQTDRQTDGGRCNISRPGPPAPREIKIGPHCSRPEVPSGWDREGVSPSPQVERKWKKKMLR